MYRCVIILPYNVLQRDSVVVALLQILIVFCKSDIRMFYNLIFYIKKETFEHICLLFKFS